MQSNVALCLPVTLEHKGRAEKGKWQHVNKHLRVKITCTLRNCLCRLVRLQAFLSPHLCDLWFFLTKKVRHLSFLRSKIRYSLLYMLRSEIVSSKVLFLQCNIWFCCCRSPRFPIPRSKSSSSCWKNAEILWEPGDTSSDKDYFKTDLNTNDLMERVTTFMLFKSTSVWIRVSLGINGQMLNCKEIAWVLNGRLLWSLWVLCFCGICTILGEWWGGGGGVSWRPNPLDNQTSRSWSSYVPSPSRGG